MHATFMLSGLLRQMFHHQDLRGVSLLRIGQQHIRMLPPTSHHQQRCTPPTRHSDLSLATSYADRVEKKAVTVRIEETAVDIT